MDIDISDTAPEQSVTLDETQDFRIGGDASTGQTQQGVHDDLAMTEITQSKFTENARMRENHSGIEQAGEHLITRAKMIDPNRGVNQDHLEPGRRRGGAPRPGSLPPRRANRRALSRSIRALSASRTRLDFSFTPVKA